MCASHTPKFSKRTALLQVRLRETCKEPGPRCLAPDNRDLFQDALPWVTHQRGGVRAQGWPLLTVETKVYCNYPFATLIANVVSTTGRGDAV
jgi:hypothetical protein